MLLHDPDQRLDVALLRETGNAILILRGTELILWCFQAAQSTFNFELVCADLVPSRRSFAPLATPACV